MIIKVEYTIKTVVEEDSNEWGNTHGDMAITEHMFMEVIKDHIKKDPQMTVDMVAENGELTANFVEVVRAH